MSSPLGVPWNSASAANAHALMRSSCALGGGAAALPQPLPPAAPQNRASASSSAADSAVHTAAEEPRPAPTGSEGGSTSATRPPIGMAAPSPRCAEKMPAQRNNAGSSARRCPSFSATPTTSAASAARSAAAGGAGAPPGGGNSAQSDARSAASGQENSSGAPPPPDAPPDATPGSRSVTAPEVGSTRTRQGTRKSDRAPARAGCPYTTACSPNRINLPGALAKVLTLHIGEGDFLTSPAAAGRRRGGERGRGESEAARASGYHGAIQ